MTERTQVSVALEGRAYDIHIGGGLLAEAGKLIAAALPRRRVVLVTDANVAPLHLAAVARSLSDAGIRALEPVILPAGEQSKSFPQLASLLEALLEGGIDRRTVLVALGGGVIGDLVGFAAAIALRGIDFVQIPTTLLAQVDSSVGGKTGINTAQGKNLVGAFHQPRLVLADTAALDTLPRRELLAGYSEIVKYGLIDQPDFFAWLEANGKTLLDGDLAARRHAVEVSCRAKAAVVAADEKEAGARALLNLGHTFGHALEAELGYDGRLLHGEAVAIGMKLAFDLSVELGLCPADDRARVERHLQATGLPHRVPAALSGTKAGTDAAGRLLAHMRLDKKAADGKLTFILARGIGKSFIANEVEEAPVLAVLRRALAR